MGKTRSTKKPRKKRAAKKAIVSELSDKVEVEVGANTKHVSGVTNAVPVVTKGGVIKRFNLIQISDPLRLTLRYSNVERQNKIMMDPTYITELGEYSEDIIKGLTEIISKTTGGVASLDQNRVVE